MTQADTTLGAGESQFPPTAWSLVERLRDRDDPRLQAYLNRVAQAYWRPVYKYVRIAWRRSNEDAKDLTQAFFVHLLEGDLLARADPKRGNFRHLLLAALKNFLSNDARAGQAAKRGGDRSILSLDGEIDDEGTADPADPEACFEAQWAREILGRAIERLKAVCRPELFTAFRRFHLEDAPVRDIAKELGTRESQVAHYLQDARSTLRRLVTDEIREYVRDESEITGELDRLFQGWK